MVEFAEDSAEDYESSDKSSDEEEKKRKWAENLYYYNCPVFRVSFNIRSLSIQPSCNGWPHGLKIQILLFQTTLYFNHSVLNLDDTEAENWRDQQ